MSKKKLLLLVSVLLLVVGSVVGTLAYFTDSDAATNTFAIGKVGITMTESNVDQDIPDGATEAPDRDMANDYHLIPGSTYTKDPTIYVDANSEDCYLFVKVVNDIAAIEKTDADVSGQLDTNGWDLVSGDVYCYCDASGKPLKVSANAEVNVFETITVDGAVDSDTLAKCAGKTITVTAYAIQSAGFENATAAEIWAAGGWA